MLLSDLATHQTSAEGVGGFPWYAVRVRSNSEQIVAAALRRQGYEAFNPSYVERRQWSDRIRIIDRPLFAGYVFCRLDVSRRLPVLQTRGVVELVGVGKIPERIPETEIRAIQQVIASGLNATPCPFINIGEHVMIVCGPLAGAEGILTKLKNTCRVVVSISLLQRSVMVEVDGAWIKANRPRQHLASIWPDQLSAPISYRIS